MRHDSFICVTWLIYMCDMTYACVPWLTECPHPAQQEWPHSYARHDSFLRETWLIHISYVRHDSFICETWLIQVWRDSREALTLHSIAWFVCDMTLWYVSMIHMTQLYVRHDSCKCATWLIHVWHDSLICVHDSFIRETWLNRKHDMRTQKRLHPA